MIMTSHFKKTFTLFFVVATIVILFIVKRTPDMYSPFPKVRPKVCPVWTAVNTITPLNSTKHFLVSAFKDRRVKGFDVRIISIFKRNSIRPLYCLFCCEGQLSKTQVAKILQLSQNFGYAFGTTLVMCLVPDGCNASHVTLQTEPERPKVVNQIWLPIRNQRSRGEEEERMQFNFTVCISNLFGGYNNVLQYAQTLEMYRLLGVDRVVIYNTSCGPELDRLLKSYSQTGFVEVVPWPIDMFLKPSIGWVPSRHRGQLHFFGQLTTMNECVYRSMERSRYVLLNDIDEIIMPYKYDSLVSLMDVLQQQHPETGVFFIQNHVFPGQYSEPSGRFRLPQWDGLPGLNILEHISKLIIPGGIPFKMIIQPRLVEQVAVHRPLKFSGGTVKVPRNVCRMVHVKNYEIPRPEDLREDKRLWDFQEKLIPNVDRALRRAGLLRSGNGSEQTG
ncbi:uncharacterized protein LOC141806609 [Halichoeres trimaculatus]|uniref:uncharacterized protein LOC141806609 n=1 Tax=Halichoeres trimaculatus TaxID=147232 RepID=UPI003D9DF34C